MRHVKSCVLASIIATKTTTTNSRMMLSSTAGRARLSKTVGNTTVAFVLSVQTDGLQTGQQDELFYRCRQTGTKRVNRTIIGRRRSGSGIIMLSARGTVHCIAHKPLHPPARAKIRRPTSSFIVPAVLAPIKTKATVPGITPKQPIM